MILWMWPWLQPLGVGVASHHRIEKIMSISNTAHTFWVTIGNLKLNCGTAYECQLQIWGLGTTGFHIFLVAILRHWWVGAGQLFHLGSSKFLSHLTLEAQHCIWKVLVGTDEICDSGCVLQELDLSMNLTTIHGQLTTNLDCHWSYDFFWDMVKSPFGQSSTVANGPIWASKTHKMSK